jgi:hypothetical protein
VTLHELPRDRRHVDILVGAYLAIGLVCKESRPGLLTVPSAEKTGFEWALMGPSGTRSDSPLDCLFLALNNEQLSELQRAQYECDFMVRFEKVMVGSGPFGEEAEENGELCWSRNEEQAMQIMQDDHRNGRWPS